MHKRNPIRRVQDIVSARLQHSGDPVERIYGQSQRTIEAKQAIEKLEQWKLEAQRQIEIKDRLGNVLHTSTKPTLKEAVEEAVANNVSLFQADLNGAYLYAANLQGADLIDSYLSNADLVNADLQGARLDHAILNGANLIGANLSGAKLYNAVLANAYLANADLSNADLTYVSLTNISFNTGTNVQGANFTNAIDVPQQWQQQQPQQPQEEETQPEQQSSLEDLQNQLYDVINPLSGLPKPGMEEQAETLRQQIEEEKRQLGKDTGKIYYGRKNESQLADAPAPHPDELEERRRKPWLYEMVDEPGVGELIIKPPGPAPNPSGESIAPHPDEQTDFIEPDSNFLQPYEYAMTVGPDTEQQMLELEEILKRREEKRKQQGSTDNPAINNDVYDDDSTSDGENRDPVEYSGLELGDKDNFKESPGSRKAQTDTTQTHVMPSFQALLTMIEPEESAQLLSGWDSNRGRPTEEGLPYAMSLIDKYEQMNPDDDVFKEKMVLLRQSFGGV